ncbi:MAG: hypothetical protein ABSF87_06385 [Xanthobacteraceae bacterium]
MARSVQRTWRSISEKICLVNRLPPGFRIVLRDEDGRAKRDDILVREDKLELCNGDFLAYPGSFRIWAFLDEAVMGADCLDCADTQLRDHRDKPVDPNLTLRMVRDMRGAGGRHTKGWEDDQDNIRDLESEIEDALASFHDDYRLANDQEHDVLLKALIHYIISQFDTDALEYVLDFYKAEIERKARHETE